MLRQTEPERRIQRHAEAETDIYRDSLKQRQTDIKTERLKQRQTDAETN